MMNIKLLESKGQGDDLEGDFSQVLVGYSFFLFVCFFVCFLLICLLSIELQNFLMRPQTKNKKRAGRKIPSGSFIT